MLEISFRCIMSCVWNAHSDLGVVCVAKPLWPVAQVTPGKCWSGSVTASLAFPVPAGLEHWAQNTEFNITFLSFLTEGEPGGLWEWLCWCCVCQSHRQSTCASEVLLLAQTPWQLRDGAVFCWAWVTLAEMSAEPALALSAFTVSCKVNQILLCDDKCYSWKSSWRRLSIRSVQKRTTSRGVLFCWSSAVCGAPGSCAAPRGSSGRMLWVPFETFPVFHKRIRGKGYCHYIEWNWVFDHPWGFDTQNWLKPWAVLCRRQELPEACSIILCVLCSSVDVLGRN